MIGLFAGRLTDVLLGGFKPLEIERLRENRYDKILIIHTEELTPQHLAFMQEKYPTTPKTLITEDITEGQKWKAELDETWRTLVVPSLNVQLIKNLMEG